MCKHEVICFVLYTSRPTIPSVAVCINIQVVFLNVHHKPVFSLVQWLTVTALLVPPPPSSPKYHLSA
jgi:hypothetical protein